MQGPNTFVRTNATIVGLRPTGRQPNVKELLKKLAVDVWAQET